jgi:hypothetical protein
MLPLKNKRAVMARREFDQGETMDSFEPPKYLASLIAAINDGAKAAQTGALAFAAVGLYLLATAFSATDEDLLLDRTLAISQLGAQISVTVSFAMMPILFLALHVFTLIRYDMLAIKRAPVPRRP